MNQRLFLVLQIKPLGSCWCSDSKGFNVRRKCRSDLTLLKYLVSLTGPIYIELVYKRDIAYNYLNR